MPLPAPIPGPSIPASDRGEGTRRHAQSGPVFAVDHRDGRLRMRHSARQRNIVRRDDPATQQAAADLLALFSAGDDHILRVRSAPGEGIRSNDVLHRRDGFRDDPGHPRLILRARCCDRIDAPRLE